MSRRLVLVTGGAGFIGSNIVANLCEAGVREVAVCDRLETAELGKWKNLAKHPIADLVEPEHLFDWLEAHHGALEAVVHMGAISSTTEPDVDLIVRTNFSLSKALWAWCAHHRKRLIYASSAATYGDGTAGFDDADDAASLARLRPLNAYGWSKALFDLHARREADRGRAPPQWAGLKFFNVYGPNEYHKGAMRSVVHQMHPQASRGEAVRLFKSHREGYADGGQLRDFVYVKDAAQVVDWLLETSGVSGIYNLGAGQARSFADLAAATFRAAGHEPAIEYIDMPEGLRAQYQYFTEAPMARLRAAGYHRPFATLEEGVADYVRGYLSRPDPYR